MYHIMTYTPAAIDEYLKHGDGRHKTELLYQKLKEEGFEVRKIKVLFDWRDLPIPERVLFPLKHGTLWANDSLVVKMHGRWIRLDCTWPQKMKKLGFPVTEHWDGQSDTEQVTSQPLGFYDAVSLKGKLKLGRDEAATFAHRFNVWLDDALLKAAPIIQKT